MLAGLVVLVAVVVLSAVLSTLSSTLWGPGERLLDEQQSVVIPPEFWTTMREFLEYMRKDMQEMHAVRAAMEPATEL